MSKPIIVEDGAWMPTRDNLEVKQNGSVVWKDTGYEFDGEVIGKVLYSRGKNLWYWHPVGMGQWASADTEALALDELLCEVLPEFIQTESEHHERLASWNAELQGDLDRDEV